MFGKAGIILGVFFLSFLFSCNSQNEQDRNGGTAWGTGSFDSNGERIYFTATSEQDTAITYTGGPSVNIMVTGGRLACVSCHGIDARGRKHTMDKEIIIAPDIRWSALSADHHEEHGSGEESKEHEGYNFESFRNSVVNGEHPDGEDLSKDMPRWHMSDSDLHDLMNYLQSLD